jgi:hypothetical protein
MRAQHEFESGGDAPAGTTATGFAKLFPGAKGGGGSLVPDRRRSVIDRIIRGRDHAQS